MGVPLKIGDGEEIALGLSLHEARALYLADLRIRRLLDSKESKEEERKVAKGDTVALSDASQYALALSGSEEAANEDHQDPEKDKNEEGKAEESKEQDRAKRNFLKDPQDLTPAEEEEVKELKQAHRGLLLGRTEQIYRQHVLQLKAFERKNEKDPLGVEKALKTWRKELTQIEQETRALPHLWQQFKTDLKQRLKSIR